ncbi:methyl-accepting chemotaxis protein [Aeromonas hydrophila]|uniref:methyl-accepting chemotaxis protein n=1 Tax=Aeromonas hydrophila TaxID=644 RepID=UPI00076034CD|nr:methyl-accepting chemotaxis protein [Aeromonas hydrophila]KWR65613.1 chemotaxis protein [Aeromonas hydrophila]HAU4930921.1 methyl-accepting chemotaxis protein [Aeromonas hydrophila]
MLIRHKLILNTALVAVAMLVLSGLFLYSNQVSRHLTEAQRNVDGLEIAMLNLRRAEKDFLIRKDPAFVTRFNEVLANFHQLNQTLGQDDNLSAVQGELTRLDQQMGAYGKAFNDLVAQQQIIGLGPEDGLYGRLRTAVHQVEEGLKQLDEQGLLITMLQLRRAEKDFMLRSDIQYLERFQTLHKDFQLRLATLPEADRGKLEQASEQYRQDFVALVQGMQVLGLSEDEGLRNEMRGLVHQTEQGFTAVGKHIADELVRQTSRLNTLMLVCGGIIIVLIGIMSMLLGRSIDRPISRVNDTVNRIRQDNDLRLKIELQGADEMAQLAGNLDVMLGGFRHLIGDVKQSVHTLTEAADHLSGNVRRTSEGADRQLQETDMVATASTEMGSTIEEIARNTEQAANNAQTTNNKAMEGRSAVENTVSQIRSLADNLENSSREVAQLQQESETIGSVLDVIRGIAEQTNLLALNAAIEAARAGDQGRGFAVVADEVRSLAIRTQKSTQEITGIISSLQKQTGNIVGMMATCREQGNSSSEQASMAGELLEQITQDVTHIMDMSTQIAAAIEQQSLVANEVNRNVNNIRDIAQESSLMAEENAKSSHGLTEQAKLLNQAVAKYRV